ncbi:hypothetical protein PMAYCL1PPCAC_19021, partial [Pristionchus mayeri]
LRLRQLVHCLLHHSNRPRREQDSQTTLGIRLLHFIVSLHLPRSQMRHSTLLLSFFHHFQHHFRRADLSNHQLLQLQSAEAL